MPRIQKGTKHKQEKSARILRDVKASIFIFPTFSQQPLSYSRIAPHIQKPKEGQQSQEEEPTNLESGLISILPYRLIQSLQDRFGPQIVVLRRICFSLYATDCCLRPQHPRKVFLGLSLKTVLRTFGAPCTCSGK